MVVVPFVRNNPSAVMFFQRYGTKYENGIAYLLSYTVSVEKLWTQNTRIIHDV